MPANPLIEAVTAFGARFDEGEPAVNAKRLKNINAARLHHLIH